MRDLLLGVDSGGSKTVLYLVDADANIVFSSCTSGANPIDNPQWRTCFRTLLSDVSALQPSIVHACVSVGSYRESEEVDEQVRAELGLCLDGIPVTIENDVYVAHDAAFQGEAGILLIAGTGSMAVCRSASGEVYRIGGFGPQFGDEGSAYWVGREALSLATQALDGRGSKTRLTQTLTQALDLDEANGISAFLAWCSNLKHPRSQISALSKVVFSTADAGDPVARSIMERAADHLGQHVAAARMIPGCADTNWSMLGGMSASTSLVARLDREYRSHVEPKLPPWGGALWRAAFKAGWLDQSDWLDRLAKNLSTEMKTAR